MEKKTKKKVSKASPKPEAAPAQEGLKKPELKAKEKARRKYPVDNVNNQTRIVHSEDKKE